MSPITNHRRSQSTNQHNRQRSNRNITNLRIHQRSTVNSERLRQKRHNCCGICQADHSISKCKKFYKMNLAHKYQTVIKLHYCVNCLARNHLIGNCTSKIRCQRCGGKHHSVLHGPQRILTSLPTERAAPNNRHTIVPRSPPTLIPSPRQSKISTQVLKLPSSMVKTLVPAAVVQVITQKKTLLALVLLNPSLTTSRIALSFMRDTDMKPFKVEEKIYVKVIIAANVPSSIRYEAYMLAVNDLPRTPYQNNINESVKDKVCRIFLADPEFCSTLRWLLSLADTSILLS